MAIGQSLTQQQEQRQVQTATVQQMQLSHLLELPADAIDEEIEKAIDDNPALERDDNRDEIKDYFSDRQENMRVRRNNDNEENSIENWAADQESDTEILARQISEMELTDEEQQIMNYLAGSLDENGFLDKDDLTLCDEMSFTLYLDVTEDKMHQMVGLLQTLEPSGIGAHNLQECLVLQIRNKKEELKNKKGDTAILDIAAQIVERYFEDFATKRRDFLMQSLGISQEQLQQAEHEIRSCNPHPGKSLTSTTAQSAPTITPDFLLTADEGGHIAIEPHQRHQPRLHISPVFQGIIDDYSKIKNPNRDQQDSYIYAKDRVERANAYLTNLQRRRETLLSTMREIAHWQRDFFLHEDDETLLRPLRLQDVADRVGVDISTISRAANSKYVETAYGLYPLRQFFNAQTMEHNGQLVSSTQLKSALRTLIEQEDKAHPLTDEELTRLMNDQGYKIARRTVAKYRDQMGILPNKLRIE